jgi:hypothetical protein
MPSWRGAQLNKHKDKFSLCNVSLPILKEQLTTAADAPAIIILQLCYLVSFDMHLFIIKITVLTLQPIEWP